MASDPNKSTQAAQQKLVRSAEVVKESAAKQAESAAVIEESAVQQEESADRRTVLAANRTILAAERTYAAWTRTGLASLASGVGARALLEEVVPSFVASGMATMLVLFSGFCFVAAVWREVWTGATPPRPDVRRLPSAVLIVSSGFLLLVALAVLAGLWIDLV